MSKTTEVKETPLMKQYNTIKAKYPDAILLFRVGDFYETFGEDGLEKQNADLCNYSAEFKKKIGKC